MQMKPVVAGPVNTLDDHADEPSGRFCVIGESVARRSESEVWVRVGGRPARISDWGR